MNDTSFSCPLITILDLKLRLCVCLCETVKHLSRTIEAFIVRLSIDSNYEKYPLFNCFSNASKHFKSSKKTSEQQTSRASSNI